MFLSRCIYYIYIMTLYFPLRSSPERVTSTVEENQMALAMAELLKIQEEVATTHVVEEPQRDWMVKDHNSEDQAKDQSETVHQYHNQPQHQHQHQLQLIQTKGSHSYEREI